MSLIAKSLAISKTFGATAIAPVKTTGVLQRKKNEADCARRAQRAIFRTAPTSQCKNVNKKSQRLKDHLLLADS